MGGCDCFLFFLLCALCGLCGENFLVLQLGRERQQCDVACALDRFPKPPLVARARARHAARKNFASILHEWLKHLDLLVVDEVHALDTEPANAGVRLNLALAYYKSARISQAIEQLEKVHQADSKNEQALLLLAASY